LAEYVAVDESTLVAKPARLGHIEAASIAMTGVTAWQALVEAADLGKKQKVLIHAGAGGVGATAIQLARHLGAYVSGTCSDRNLYYVLDLGAHRSIDYSRGRFEEIVSERDVVLDSIGGRVTLRSIQATREGGTVVSIADQWTRPEHVTTGLDAMTQAWLRWRCQWLARRRGVRWVCLRTRTDAGALRAVADLYQSGVLRPQVSRIFDFKETGDAIAMSRGLRVRGKLVVAVDGEVGRDASPSEGVLWDSHASYRSVSLKREQDKGGTSRSNGDEEATWGDRPVR
jgi:NADPH:quinone reductase-like Zn-dependent oxidoreductase